MERIGRYEIEETCRYEFLGRVARARHLEDGREVLLVELSVPATVPQQARETLLRSFESECARLARITDPRIAPPIDACVSPSDGAFIAFELPERGGFLP